MININKEYLYLHHKVFQELGVEESDFNSLYDINKELWSIEDEIRLKEKNKEFDDIFIDLARSVYVTNDKRAEIKKVINKKYNSTFVEEKSYKPY